VAKFKITTEDGTFNVEADNADDALSAIDQYSSKNYMGPADKNGVPEGMVYDPATNRMVDAKALANKEVPGGSMIGDALKGVPFVGEYADELAGYLSSSSDTKNHPNESQPIQTEVARQAQQTFEKENPKTALASKLAVGATTLPLAIEGAAALPAASSLLGRSLIGATAGGVVGATEGAVSGYGEGENKQNQNGETDNTRAAKAGDRAMWSGALGTVLGGATPVVADTLSAGARGLLDRFTVNRQLQQAGISRPAADAVRSAMQADDALGPVGMQRLQRSGPDAMLADSGDSAASLLDTTIQRSGRAGNIARQAVVQRANAAGQRLRGTMDLVLGQPPGINQAARDVAQRTAAARHQAYQAAYNAPIDYAARSGRDIEDVFNRTPPSILRQAIDRANEAMVINRQPNRQIMANIAPDGTVTFREMPNMQQVDELKKALQEVARGGENVDQFGRMNGRGQRIDRLARELRDAARDAVPEYRTALDLGGDKIGEDEALRLGNSLLDPSTTRENVHEFVNGLTGEQRRQIAIGLRQAIDEKMANVKTVLSDPNMDAREATAILKDMSSRAAHDKMVTALGAQRANALFRQLQQTQAALELKANINQNSKTFARQEIHRSVEERGKDSVTNAILKGEPLQVGKRSWQRLTGADANSEQARNDTIYEDIATLMTGPRGPAAQAALQRLTAAYNAGTMNQQTAREVGRILTGGALLPSYQLSKQ
jgi:hypothetical protein